MERHTHPRLPREREQKFIPKDPAFFDDHLENFADITQIYLSRPEEPWSLRLRSTNHREYSAALKSRSLDAGVLDRIEIETPITEDAYLYFAAQSCYARLAKMRRELVPGVTCDWIGGQLVPLIEAEEGSGATEFLTTYGHLLKDVTADPRYSNEWIAYDHHARRYGMDTLQPRPDIDTARVIDEIYAHLSRSSTPYILGVRGRSGSGKTTVAEQLRRTMSSQLGREVALLSTDDYHRGKKWLLATHRTKTWTNWDDKIVYDTAKLAADLNGFIASRKPIAKRSFDFTTEEPVVHGEAHPLSPVVIIEGLFPHALELQPYLNNLVELPTPLATCIGRRVMRDVTSRLNGSLGSAEQILRYQIEVAEPTYQRYSPS